jgi:hypothetical protein
MHLQNFLNFEIKESQIVAKKVLKDSMFPSHRFS